MIPLSSFRNRILRCRFLFWLATLAIALPITQAKSAHPLLQFDCQDMVSRSFPPNLNWLNFGQPGFDPRLFATFAPGQWVEYVLQIPAPGTYKLRVHAIVDGESGIAQGFIDHCRQGDPQDLFQASNSARILDMGEYTFLKAGKAILRFQVTGKNPKSQGYHVAFNSISLTDGEGSKPSFGLIYPNGARFDGGDPLLAWSAAGKDDQYTVYLDNAAQPPTKNTFLKALHLSAGEHQWYVIANSPEGTSQRSGLFHFTIGPARPYPDREYSDDFASGDLADYVNQGMRLTNGPGPGEKSLEGSAPSLAFVRDVKMAREGEVSVSVTLDAPDSSASVGFALEGGPRICATIDGAKGTLSLERIGGGYSISAITPAVYRLARWKESKTPDGDYDWQLSSIPAVLKTGTTYKLKLAYSRRSCAVMATLTDADGSNLVTLRDLTDINLPDQPMVEVTQGKAHFGQLTYKQLNRLVYPWDIDTNQVVLRPGPPGSWDSRGAFNPAVVVRDGVWHMVYRGNAKPAPPTAGFASELGAATSTDGVHWTKHAQNPIISRAPDIVTVEDPDLLQPAGTDTYYLEYVIIHPKGGIHEMMASGTDGIHFSEPWELPVKGKIGGMIDSYNEPRIPEFDFAGSKYRYLAAIEEGGIYLSNDLHAWEKMGTADYRGRPDRWCDGFECAGDIFVDADHHLRVEAQAGTQVMGKNRIGGNPLCTNVEDILDSSDPTKGIARGDLPWLPDFYGDAPTGDLNEMTFTNGSVFPGQTIVKDGYLWHYYGGNNTFTGLIKADYRPVFVYRDLHIVPSETESGPRQVEVTVRNEGGLSGEQKVTLSMDGKTASEQSVTLARDQETKLSFSVTVPEGAHWFGIDDLRAGFISGR